MKQASDLQRQLAAVNGKSYSLYKELRGSYRFDDYILSLDRVQGDPFAPPSALSAKIPFKDTGIPKVYTEKKHTRIALQDYLTRRLAAQLERFSFKAGGSGKSGLLASSRCGQTVLERTACQITDDYLIVRFHGGFPANGRRINAGALEKMLFSFIPESIEKALFYRNMDGNKLEQVIFLADDQHAIRGELKKRNLAAFVADGAVLPRESGISDRPMKESVPFSSPDTLRVTMELPHRGSMSGMGIPCGITLIAGGGYHGKSTLLNALEQGVYDHIAGDGREYVITDETAVKLRSEDGRFIKDVDISLFINDLPNGRDTHRFSTLDASGSTSQAAGIAESIEAGSRLFLIDEDTSATNFMVRDTFMQEVISRSKEPITPFIERAGQLRQQAGISTILVAGSSGAFFHIADTVIQMDCYHPSDITGKVKALCEKYPAPGAENVPPFCLPHSSRIMNWPKLLEQEKKKHKPLKVKVHSRDSFSIGKETVDLRYVEQLTDSEQTASLGKLLLYGLEQLTDGRRTLDEIAENLDEQLHKQGLESFFSGNAVCGFAAVRRQEIFACLNRLRR
ncbi:ABC-ATPase domain-containing protein [Anaerovorax odorimutans]|uniref:ABC-ATPase domain-containing protein n=1 Tax=Anaerovorax odorimutans TaxID=109327 RepID=A0ABT1RL56_9FIRM|nr:ABC-ATPase domain-containing protein [Anaerovorax odorimutans]MCQ4635920.1 ABC-ATPase domain-containing protein [Anaerovorax odorimutans]